MPEILNWIIAGGALGAVIGLSFAAGLIVGILRTQRYVIQHLHLPEPERPNGDG